MPTNIVVASPSYKPLRKQKQPMPKIGRMNIVLSKEPTTLTSRHACTHVHPPISVSIVARPIERKRALRPCVPLLAAVHAGGKNTACEGEHPRHKGGGVGDGDTQGNQAHERHRRGVLHDRAHPYLLPIHYPYTTCHGTHYHAHTRGYRYGLYVVDSKEKGHHTLRCGGLVPQ